MERKSRKSVRIELTDEQKKQIQEETGESVDAVELKLDELEERVTPRQIGTFF